MTQILVADNFIDISKLSIKEIRELLETEAISVDWLDNVAHSDGRVGVLKLIDQFKRREQARLLEYARLVEMTKTESEFWQQGLLVAGVDEAGRGPLAGPVAVAVVVLEKGMIIPGINDSKKLTENKREELAQVIKEKVKAWHVELVSHEVIDKINILQATYLGVGQCLKQLSDSFDHVLIDGNPIPKLDCPQTAIVKGDSKSLSIAAASILAKVARDQFMYKLDSVYPEYGFAQHKGYGTSEHIIALKKYGMSPIHRHSFCAHFINQ